MYPSLFLAFDRLLAILGRASWRNREGIEQYAESLLITAFLYDRKLSYPRCYPQLILRKTATEPRTLG
jgi:hypothetical protein